MLLFAFGVLGLVGLQAASIVHVRDARYHADAAFLADQIISVIRADAPNRGAYVHLSTREEACRFSGDESGNGNVTAWVRDVQAALPGSASRQQIIVAGTRVVVTLCWRLPQDATFRSYVLATDV